MATQRGGLAYTIEIHDRFSAAISSFELGLRNAEAAWGRFAHSVRAAGQSATNIQGMARSAAGGLRPLVAQVERLERAGRKLNDTNSQRNVAHRAEKARNKSQIHGMREKNRVLRDQISLLKAERRAAIRTAVGHDRATRSTKKLTKGLNKTQNAANRISFTFRRLIGILAAFTVAREIVGGFVSMIKTSIQFNASIEETKLGITALLLTTREVKDEFGNILPVGKALPLAIDESRRQMALLLRDSVKTASSFKVLSENFKTALGAAAGTGLDTDQVRKITVLLSQAASAQGIPQNQLSEEIRSTLGGTATDRTTRLAKLFGGAANLNRQIAKAKEQGKLYEFLQEKLAGISSAATEAMGTFNVMASNTKDAFTQVVATGAEGFFNELKETMSEIMDGLTSVDGINLDAIKAIKPLFDGLERSVRNIKESFDDFDLGDIERSAATLGSMFDVLSIVFVSIMEGMLEGFNDLFVIFGPFGKALSKSKVDLGKALKTLVRILVVALGLQFVTNMIAKKSKNIGSFIFRWLLIFGLLEIAVNKLSELFTGMELSLTDIGAMLGNSILFGFEAAIVGMKAAWDNFATYIQVKLKDWASSTKITFLEVQAAVLAKTPELFGGGVTAAADKTADAAIEKERRDKARLKQYTDLFARGELRDAELLAAKETYTLTDDQLITDKKEKEEKAPGSTGLFPQIKSFLGIMENDQGMGGDLAFALQPENFIESITSGLDFLLEGLGDVEDQAKDTAAAVAASAQATFTDSQEAFRDAESQLKLHEKSLGVEKKLAGIRAEQEKVRANLGQLARGEAETEQEKVALKLEQLWLERQILEDRHAVLVADLEAREAIAETLVADEKLAARIAELKELLILVDLQLSQKGGQIEQEEGRTFDEEKIRNLQEAIDSMDGSMDSFMDGIEAGALLLETRMPAAAELAFGLMETTINESTKAISGMISAAFDPDEEIDALQRLGAMFKAIADSIIQELVRIAVTKAIVGVIGAVGGGAGGVGAGVVSNIIASSPNSAQGGPVRSLAEGGSVGEGVFLNREGVDRRDTVPAWLDPTEWVIRGASSLGYGDEVMDAINRGTIDAGILKSLVGARKASGRRSSARKAGLGFAEGGSVGSASASAPAASPGSPASRAYVVADEQELDRMLTGGTRTFMRFLSSNKGRVNGALGLGTNIRG